MRTGKRGACETHQLMCVVCGALPVTMCPDGDLRELKLVHQPRWLEGIERDWRARNGWEPPERTGRGDRNAAQPGRGLALPGRRICGITPVTCLTWTAISCAPDFELRGP